jgi:N-dimethylarginine dimethylaminohydrolase
MLINKKVLMSGAEYFDDGFAINPYMDDQIPIDLDKALAEHAEIRRCFEEAGIEVIKVPAPINCQDGVYTANWALIHGQKALMSNLPNKRKAEEPYAEEILQNLGFEIVKFPENLHFSGQGDSLPCGRYLFTGSNYRTSLELHPLLAEQTGLEVISLQTIPELDNAGQPVINEVTGWPDSFFYDLDLSVAVITPTLIAWCPEAFTAESQEKIRLITDIEKIEVSFEEATKSSACNLVSTGETVIMGSRAPKLKSELEARGFKVLAPDVTELMKGGGFIRCTSLTL